MEYEKCSETQYQNSCSALLATNVFIMCYLFEAPLNKKKIRHYTFSTMEKFHVVKYKVELLSTSFSREKQDGDIHF